MRKFIYISFFMLFTGACSNEESANNAELSANQSTEASEESPDATPRKTIVFFGNSITAGYGLDPSEAFPALIQKKMDSLDYLYQVVNAGLSGETTAAGAKRIDWILKRQAVDIFVLELGGNDGLRGLATAETEKSLQEIIDKVKKAYEQALIVLTGIEVPPNMGEDYAGAFLQVFTKIAEVNQVAAFMPFILEDVGGNPELNQPDGIHPTAEGHQILAENVWEVIEPLLKK
ncbi:MAG: arylesterase [Bacteroidota bacterium]